MQPALVVVAPRGDRAVVLFTGPLPHTRVSPLVVDPTAHVAGGTARDVDVVTPALRCPSAACQPSGVATPRRHFVRQIVLRLSEGEHVRLGAGLEERDLQRPLADRVVLAHELVQAAVAEHAVAVLVDVHAV